MVIDQAQFDRVLAGIHGLPGFRQTKPTTIIDTVPIVGIVTTYVVQSFRTADRGHTIFLQVLAEGRFHRLILPSKVAQALYRQRDALADRSTPQSRARATAKRKREAERKAKAARKAKYAARNKTAQP
jgi:hypothetical protein